MPEVVETPIEKARRIRAEKLAALMALING